MDKKEFTVSEVIDSIGISSHTWVVFVLLAFAMIFDGYDFMIINSTNLFVAHTFWPDNPNPGALMGSLTTWGLLGMVLGGAVGGVISDRIGRKKTLVVAVMFYGLFTLPQAFANDIVFFAVFRLIAGFGVGSCIPVVTTVFSESMPSKQRGVFVTFGMAFMVVGWVLAGLIANPICNTPTPIVPGLCNEVTYALADGGTATMYANWRLSTSLALCRFSTASCWSSACTRRRTGTPIQATRKWPASAFLRSSRPRATPRTSTTRTC